MPTTKKTIKKKESKLFHVKHWVAFTKAGRYNNDCYVTFLAKQTNKAVKRDFKVKFLAVVDCPVAEAFVQATALIGQEYYTRPTFMSPAQNIEKYIEQIYNASLE